MKHFFTGVLYAASFAVGIFAVASYLRNANNHSITITIDDYNGRIVQIDNQSNRKVEVSRTATNLVLEIDSTPAWLIESRLVEIKPR